MSSWQEWAQSRCYVHSLPCLKLSYIPRLVVTIQLKKKKKQEKKISIDAEIGLTSIYNRKTLALYGYTAVCYIGQLLLLCSVLHGVL